MTSQTPLCKDCRWLITGPWENEPGDGEYFCGKAPLVDVVRGGPNRGLGCLHARLSPELCGMSGKLFEANP